MLLSHFEIQVGNSCEGTGWKAGEDGECALLLCSDRVY